MQDGATRRLPCCAGVGLRHPHLGEVLKTRPDVAWFEVHSENFFLAGGRAVSSLEEICEAYPCAFHGTALSLGSAAPLDMGYLRRLRATLARFNPVVVSEHLSWSVASGRHFNDLFPIPYTKESFAIFTDKVKQVQDFLGRQILIENPSSYISFQESEIPEWEFYAGLPEACGCGLLLDVNNIYVSAHNHGFVPEVYFSALNGSDIQEIHLAGFAQKSFQGDTIYVDDHGSTVHDPVWVLFRQASENFGAKPTLVEWDTDVPELDVLLAEAAKADAVLCPDLERCGVFA